MVDYEKELIALAIPKTGSISLHFSLGFTVIPEPDEYHASLKTIIKQHPETENYYKFAFVRNPWDRFHSLYKDFTLKRIYQYSGKIRHNKPLFSEFKNFNDFCINIKESEWMNNVFLQSQTEITEYKGQQGCDFIGRFENLHNDFERLTKALNIKATLNIMNKGVYKETYREYYSTEAQKAVEKLYQKDIDQFKYTF